MSIRWICTGYKRQSGCLLIVTVISVFAYTNYIGNGQVFRKVYRVMTPNQSLYTDQSGMIDKRFDRKTTSTKQYPLSDINTDTTSNLGGKPRQTVNSINTIRYLQHSNRTNKMTPRKFNINKATKLFEHETGGRIFGSVMYWVNGDIVELQQFLFTTKKYSRYHPMYFNKSFFMKAKLLGIRDTRLCDKVRLKPPYDDINSFLYILDMTVEDFLTQSINSKHNVLYLDDSNKTRLGVFIDKGKGFCPYENDLLLAPIYQCCKIRSSVYDALVNLEHRFTAVFQDMILLRRAVFTKSQLDGIESRVTAILDYVKKCFALKGRHNVLMNN